jgi:serine/threonine-protein kinase
MEPGLGVVLDGKYRIEHIVGAGGCGCVYAARHLGLDQLVAVKILRPDVMGHADVVKRFVREARVVARMRSEHITRVLDAAVLPDGPPYIVLELLEGEDLAARLKRGGALPLVEAVDHVLQACHGLAEAHALDIVHRDLKPANLFVTRTVDGTEVTKVLDFGIAKIRDEVVGLPHTSLTKDHQLLGSPSYMSPEQLVNPRRIDVRADIWSLGVTLFELLSDAPAFSGASTAAVGIKIMSEPARSLSGLAPGVPEAVAAVVARCLDKDPTKRFGGVAELGAALAPFGGARAQQLLEQICRIRKGRHPTGETGRV